MPGPKRAPGDFQAAGRLTDFLRMLRDETEQRAQSRVLEVRLITKNDRPVRRFSNPIDPTLPRIEWS